MWIVCSLLNIMRDKGPIVFLDVDIIQLPPVSVNKSWLCEEYIWESVILLWATNSTYVTHSWDDQMCWA